VKPVSLILSAAYVEPELEAEFGRLPPAFLPLGNRRLYVHQRAAFGSEQGKIFLSLPEDFEPDASDLDELARMNIEVVQVPVGLTLGQSLIYVINITAISGSSLVILHGDTLVQGPDLTMTDAVAVEFDVPPGYHWGYIQEESGRITLANDAVEREHRMALTGFFAFSNASLLVQSLTRVGGNFLQGLIAYSNHQPMRTVRSDGWLDFGHASTFHISRQAITTERKFNSLVADRRMITKSSEDQIKIEAEARWFDRLPPPLRVFTPAYLGMVTDSHRKAYRTEYLHLPTLADLYVFGRLSRGAWDRILAGCDEFLSACLPYEDESTDASPALLYLEKTLQRLEDFARFSGLSLSEPCRLDGVWLPGLEQIARRTAESISPVLSEHQTLVHGDFCFSNIFYDIRSERIRVVDPRGLDARNNISAYGDRRYDIGKLHHSAVGKYDMIMAGNFTLNRHGPLNFSLRLPENDMIRSVRGAFLERTFAGLRPQVACAHPISVLLFLSMLPLHYDDPKRQTALLANAMRLFLNLDDRVSS